jgi:protein-disulfide isomerase
VSDEEQAGGLAGVQGTPGNFLIDQNGQITEIPGAQPLANVEAAIKQLLGKK